MSGNNKKIMLLGANGFVGTHVREYLKKNGLSTINITRKEADLLIENQVEDLIKKYKPDYLVNCAAKVGSLHYVTRWAANVIVENTQMILNIYQAISKHSPHTIIINPIANCAYPGKINIYKEDHLWDGNIHPSVMPFGASRRHLLYMAQCFLWQYNIRTINLLVPNMYGPYDSTNPDKAHALNALISKFVKSEKTNKNEVEVWGSGIAIREWLYAEDFAKIVYLIIHQKDTMGWDEPLNIAQNFGLSIRELVTLINKNFNNKFTIRYNTDMPDGAPKKVMDDTRFKKFFPNFQFTPLDYGIAQTIEYYRNIDY
ncbi:MAG: NAD-dependent epimerase/dehydratase family protein [Bacteroidia bacterium]